MLKEIALTASVNPYLRVRTKAKPLFFVPLKALANVRIFSLVFIFFVFMPSQLVENAS